MQVLTSRIEGYIERSSWIRRMFEAGAELKNKVGADKVFDFSLGNPDLPPPMEVVDALGEIISGARSPLAFGYPPNAGLPATRAALAAQLSEEQKTEVSEQHVVVTCGAAGALNVLFRAVLEPEEEVICPLPYFVEYGFYTANAGGVLRPVASVPDTFALDLSAIKAAITPRTRAVLINSPNNPTGQIYGSDELAGLAALLEKHNRNSQRPIFLVSDEPYRFLTYDDAVVPPVLPLYPYSLVAGSFSKSLSLAGERIGYLVPAPQMPGVDELLNGLVLCNRILGFVNAPVIGQKIVAGALRAGVDVGIYDERRRTMAAVLDQAGISYLMPRGAFYFFARVPGNGDDKQFTKVLLEENILVVPGTGFGCPGWFRMTFCMDSRIIEGSAEGFRKGVATWNSSRR